MAVSINIATEFLADNPVPMQVLADVGQSFTFKVVRVPYNNTIFETTVAPITQSFEINLSELFNLKLAREGVRVYDIVLEQTDVVLSTKRITVYPGGISKSIRRSLARRGETIFTTKINPSSTNFMLTTRTFSDKITIPYDELMPIPFWRAGKNFDFIGKTYSYPSGEQRIAWLDLNELLQTQTGSFPITASGAVSATIEVVKVQEQHDYFIEFRNSLGAMERVALSGINSSTPSISTRSVSEFDSTTNELTQLPLSRDYVEVISASIRAIRRSERLFLLDMLLSEEQYLLTPAGKLRVRVSMHDSMIDSIGVSPEKLTVSIETIEAESWLSLTDNEKLWQKYEDIFKEEFTKEFN